MKNNNKNIYLLVPVLLFIVLVYSPVDAKITGNCANCHTMHNSQNGSVMATYGATGQPWKGTGPYGALTRGTCLGCHGMGTANKIVTIGGSDTPRSITQMPQVIWQAEILPISLVPNPV